MRTPLLALSAGLTLISVPAFADSPAPATSNLPITHVALYTSGVGYFERGGSVNGDATQTLLFPVGQINDVLKSLVVLDTGGGSIQPVTYAARDPLAKQLQSFSLDLSDNPDQATLLTRLRGATVTVTITGDGAPKVLTGVIVGVETHTITLPNDRGTTEQSILNLMADDGLHAIPLPNISSLQIADPKLNDELRQALKVVSEGRDASKRPVTLAFTGKGRRNVLIGYLTETPLWQTTYRLVLGAKPMLQGWALVQNTSQDDWSNIDLKLVSGRPISFIQDLYTPLYVPRPTVQARVQASPTPQTYASDLNAPVVASLPPAEAPAPTAQAMDEAGSDMKSADGASLPAGVKLLHATDANNSLVAGKMSSIPYAQSVATTGAKLGTALFTYQIKVPVTVPRQQSAMIPFVASGIQAEAVSIYNSQSQSEHPLAGARVKNTTGLHLMGGPLTVFDDGGSGTGYVGDALVDDTEPNQTRLISYAIDQAIDAETTPGSSSGEILSIIISRGVLIASRKYEESAVYTFKNNSAKPRLVVVEHPYRGDEWKLIEPKAATERTASLYRFDVPVAAGASKKFTVREQYPQSESYGLMDSDLNTLLVYSRQGQASAEVKQALAEVITRRQKLSSIQRKITDIDAQSASISQGQQRIRENMKTLDHASALYRRYVGELDAQETKLQTLASQRASLQDDLAQARADLNDYVGKLNLQ